MNATVFPSPQGQHGGRAAAKPAAPLNRNVVIAVSVVGLHVAFIWALQSGLLMRAAEIVVPAVIMTQFVNPPAPKAEPVPPAPTPPAPVKKTVTRAPVQPAPLPLAITDPTPAPNAPVGVTTPPAPPAPVVAAAPPAAPPGPPVVQLPSSDADYLQNPKPAYPAISRRLNEQGKSIVRVMIGTDGLPQRAEVSKSSGFDRLDQAAITAVMRWRFVPGKRNGVVEAMWFNVPINWVLE